MREEVIGVIKIIDGDISTTDKDIIVQQVNCMGAMGKGLALTLMTRYPNVRTEYIAFHKKQMRKAESNRDLLGMVNYVDTYDEKIVANIFGQVEYAKSKYDKTLYTEEGALLKGIKQVKDKAEKLGFSVAIPTYIGCGLANGNWESIRPAIEAVFEGSPVDVTFYHYRK